MIGTYLSVSLETFTRGAWVPGGCGGHGDIGGRATDRRCLYYCPWNYLSGPSHATASIRGSHKASISMTRSMFDFSIQVTAMKLLFGGQTMFRDWFLFFLNKDPFHSTLYLNANIGSWLVFKFKGRLHFLSFFMRNQTLFRGRFCFFLLLISYQPTFR